MTSIFSKIINQEIPSFKLYENNLVYVFLDINPLSSGHCLVVPKFEADKIQEIPTNYLQEIFVTAQKICPILEKALSAKRVAMKVEGWEVPHFHLHLVPVYNLQESPLKFDSQKAEEEDLRKIQKKLLTEIEKSFLIPPQY